MANYLSQSDIDNYGADLVDFSRRAAADALAPTFAAARATKCATAAASYAHRPPGARPAR